MRETSRKGTLHGPTLITDIPPEQAFVSPVDGSLITSRTELREHNARNGVTDVGNDPAYRHPKPPKREMPSSAPLIADIIAGRVPVEKAIAMEE